MFFPLLMKGVGSELWQGSGFCPGTHWIKSCAVNQSMKWLKNPAESDGHAVYRGMAHKPGKGEEGNLLSRNSFHACGVAAVLQEVVMQVDFHRAGLGAGTAK